MKITIRVIALTAGMTAVSSAAAVASYTQLPTEQSAASLFEAVIAAATLVVGGTLTVGMYMIEARRQRKEREAEAAEAARLKAEAIEAERVANARRVQWALRRVAVEVIDAIEETQQLLDDPFAWNLTPLADDAWVTSSGLLEAHMHCGPMHYAFNDFFKSLRVLQKADYLRVLRMGTIEADQTRAMIEVQARKVIEAGNETLDLLREKGEDVHQRIEERIALGPAFAHPAHAEALAQQRSETLAEHDQEQDCDEAA